MIRCAGALAVARVCLFSLPIPALAQTPLFTAADMLDIVSFAGGQPTTFSSSGEWAAYVLPSMEEEWNVLEGRPVGSVAVHALNAGPEGAQYLTEPNNSRVHSSFPVWSPVGSHLAFFIEREAGGQLAVWDSQTGATRTYGETFSGRAYLAPQWDPSGERIVYSTAVRDRAVGESPRVGVVRSSDQRLPGDDFFVNRRRAGLSVVDLISSETSALLREATYLRRYLLSPKGSHAIYTVPSSDTFGLIGQENNETFLLDFSANASPCRLDDMSDPSWLPDGRLLFRRQGQLMAMPTAGTPDLFLPSMTNSPTNFVWSPSGKHFVTLVPDTSIQDPEIEPRQPAIYTIARPFMDLYLVSAEDGSSRNLTETFPDQVANPVWSLDGKAVFFRTVDNTTYAEAIRRYTLEDKNVEIVTQGEESYRSLQPAGAALALSIEDAMHPADLWVLDDDSGIRTRLTRLNPQLDRFTFSKPELFYFNNMNGERLGALFYKPTGWHSGQDVPVITYVYEKLTPSRHRFSARRQIFVSHGYALLMPNVKVKVGETATSFVESVVPAVNAARTLGFSSGKFCMWGGSFGAYATSYVITQTDIFECAISRATPPELFRNWASGRDRDSNNIETGQARMGASPFEAMDRYISQLAFFHLDKVNTPVLIMHGKEDKTILVGEGEMMFYALRRLGKEAELVIYKSGDHSLSRHSREDTLDVYRRMLVWFERYLKSDPNSEGGAGKGH